MTTVATETCVIPELLQNGNTRDEEFSRKVDPQKMEKTLILLPSYRI